MEKEEVRLVCEFDGDCQELAYARVRPVRWSSYNLRWEQWLCDEHAAQRAKTFGRLSVPIVCEFVDQLALRFDDGAPETMDH